VWVVLDRLALQEWGRCAPHPGGRKAFKQFKSAQASVAVEDD
jgi:hypothetical protein